MTEEQQERFFARVRAVASEDLRRKIDREDEELMAEMRERLFRATRIARERPAPDRAPT